MALDARLSVRRAATGLAAAATALLSACSLAPAYVQPALPVADQWPLGAQSTSGPAAADIGWREFFADAGLQSLIAQALANNRDLRVAVLNVQRTQALYRIRRADRLPSLEATATGTRQRALNGSVTEVSTTYDVQVGVPAFELDLFGRVANLSQAALEQYLAQDAARRGAQLSLIAEVARTYLTLMADRQSLQLASDTLKSQSDSFELTRKRYEKGGASGLDLAQAETTVETARADAARFEGQVAQDLNALTLLVGGPVDPALLPQAAAKPVTALSSLPVGLPSTVLLRRPDVIAAEHQLRAANANIGAARAAFFPSISLTASAGTASNELSGLFKHGSGIWSFVPQLSLPIFEGGRLQASLDAAQVDRDIALAQYEKSIQGSFREVADALALSGALARQKAAAQTLAQAARRAYELSESRYKAGRDSYLVVLDSQRSDYAAQQRLIDMNLAEQINRVALYKALGGGWLEHGSAGG